jgi:hypothetical protein
MEVDVQETHLATLLSQGQGKVYGNAALPHPAFSAHDKYLVLDSGQLTIEQVILGFMLLAGACTT